MALIDDGLHDRRLGKWGNGRIGVMIEKVMDDVAFLSRLSV